MSSLDLRQLSKYWHCSSVKRITIISISSSSTLFAIMSHSRCSSDCRKTRFVFRFCPFLLFHSVHSTLHLTDNSYALGGFINCDNYQCTDKVLGLLMLNSVYGECTTEDHLYHIQFKRFIEKNHHSNLQIGWINSNGT